ncbi:MAG: triose-phosphate isomerase [bacterium]|nr:triose-phosphate isomerase [bacterium]
MRQKIICGNWKMNGTVAETESLIGGLLSGESRNPKATAVVCPPYTSLGLASKLLQGSHIALGAQDMSEHEKGAYTGEISAQMLLTLGVTFVILGHSERRQYHAESDDLINRKAKAALVSGLIPIICVGETLAERESGRTEQIVGTQVDGVLAGFGDAELGRIVLAYEPVWAIGTGRTATPAMAQEVHRFIRQRISQKNRAAAERLPILYGGSVKGDNALGLLAEADIDGALVGGACLKADEFIRIINAV